MSYYPCAEHRVAFLTRNQFTGHWNRKHTGQPPPSDKEVITETVPAEFRVMAPPQERGGEAASAVGKGGSQEQAGKEPTPGAGAGKGPTPGAGAAAPVYGGGRDASAILKEILIEFPGLPEGVVSEVMSWTKYGPLHPTDVFTLLQQMEGVHKGAPVLIQRKYELALRHAQAGTPSGPTGLIGPGAPGAGPAGMLGWGAPGGGGGLFQGPALGGWPPQGGESPAVLDLRQQFSAVQQEVAGLVRGMQERERREEEQRREAEHQRELDEIRVEHAAEIARVEAANKEALDRIAAQQKEAMERLEERLKPKTETPPEVVEMRSELTRLRDQLREAEKAGHEREVEQLKERIKAIEGREPTQPSDMGLIQHTADKLIDAAREAGGAVKDLAIGAQKGQQLFPGRRTPEERKAVGQELLAKARKGQQVMKDMDALFAGS